MRRATGERTIWQWRAISGRAVRTACLAVLVLPAALAGDVRETIALALDPCLALFHAPATPENRLAELYGKLLGQYRVALGRDETYLQAIERALREDRPYAWSATTAAQSTLVEHFDRLRLIDESGRLPDGTRVSAAEIRVELRRFLESERVALRGARAVIEAEVRERAVISTPIRALENHASQVIAIDLNREGTRGFSIDITGEMLIRDSRAGKVIHRIQLESGRIFDVRTSGDFKRAIIPSVSDGLTIVNLETGAILGRFVRHVPDSAVAVSADFRRGVAGGDLSAVFDVETGKVLVQLDSEGRYLDRVAADRDFNRAAGFAGSEGFVWSLGDGKVIRRFGFPGETLSFSALGTDARRALTYSKERGAHVWDLGDAASPPRPLAGLGADAVYAVISPDSGRALIYDDVQRFGAVQTATLWNLETAERIRDIAVEGVFRLASPDFRYAINTTDREECVVWNIETGVVLSRFPWNEYGLKVSPDFRRAVVGVNQNEAMLVDLLTGKTSPRLVGHRAMRVFSLGASADFDRIWTGGSNGEVIEWIPRLLEVRAPW